MRALIMALVLLFSGAALAEYKLRVDEDKVVYNPAEWEITSAANGYRIYVLKESMNSNEKYPIAYTLVEFDEPEGRKLIDVMPPIKRIYTAGVMECPNQLFNLMDEYYVGVQDQIIYVSMHEGDYPVEMRTPGTARRAVYEKVCTN